MKPDPAVFTCRERRGIFLRSLTLQASWNPSRMQALGLCHTLLPWMKRAGLKQAGRRAFCRRHLEYFNTNPYYANLLVGGVLRLEAEAQAAGTDAAPATIRFKETLGRALAALGDQFFWLGLQPGLLVLACLLGVLAPIWTPLAIIGVFTVAQLVLRFRFLGLGWDLGLDIVDLLAARRWHRAIWAAKRAGALLTGALAATLAFSVEDLVRAGQPGTAVGAALAVGLAFSLRRRWAGETLLLILVPLALAASYL